MISKTSPETVLVALKKLIRLVVLLSRVPPLETVVNVLLVEMSPPNSAITPVDVRLTLEKPAAIEPVMPMAPTLLTVMRPPPPCVIPVMIKGEDVLNRLMTPPIVLVALKEPTVLALFKRVPKAELVVSKPVVLRIPPAFSPTLPVALRVMLPPAAADTRPVKLIFPVLSIAI